MTQQFTRHVIDTGRLPLFFLLVAFVLTFLFIRFSVRMIRAEVSWWPGNVTPGGMHIHHVVFGLIAMLGSGFCFIAVASFHTPVANVVLASVFGIGSALVLDEFALVLHLRDVYWAKEGRSSIDAIFVAVAVTMLFLLGLHPIGFAGDFVGFEADRSILTLVVESVLLAAQLALALITLFKGKLWTGLVGLFFVPLLVVGAWRLSRPGAPWARWRYGRRPNRYARAVAREHRYREPVVRWKIALQELLGGRFGVPEPIPTAAPVVVEDPVEDPVDPRAHTRRTSRVANAVRWRRTRRALAQPPVWRLPLVLVAVATLAALLVVSIDDPAAADLGATATLLAVIAGAMVTLTGLVFTATTLAMQFGASQLSVRVVPMLQAEPVMQWATGMFLATFIFSLIGATDLALNSKSSAPIITSALAIGLTLVSVVFFVALVAKVGSVLNSTRLLRWIADQGRTSIARTYREVGGFSPTGDVTVRRHPNTLPSSTVATFEAAEADLLLRLQRLPAHGRVLLAVDVARMQRLATRWGVTVALQPSIGEFVALGAVLFEVHGPTDRVVANQLVATLLFGDTHSPRVSPTAALQSLTDVALKALSPAINDPGRAVQALDHLEDLLLLLAPLVAADSASSTLTRIRGYRRSWADYVAVATDEIRHFSGGSTQVQRRLRALLQTLLERCPLEQHAPLLERLAALDEQRLREWHGELDLRLAGVGDPQGLGSEAGTAGRVHRLVLGTAPIDQRPSLRDPA